MPIVRRTPRPIVVEGSMVVDPKISALSLRLYLVWLYFCSGAEQEDEAALLGVQKWRVETCAVELEMLGYIERDKNEVILLNPHAPTSDAFSEDPRLYAEYKRRQGEASEKPGYVYLLKAGPYYKIGKTQNVDERIKQLATLPPFDLELVHVIPSPQPHKLESVLHKRFDDLRVNGEWFLLGTEDVEYIEEL